MFISTHYGYNIIVTIQGQNPFSPINGSSRPRSRRPARKPTTNQRPLTTTVTTTVVTTNQPPPTKELLLYESTLLLQ